MRTLFIKIFLSFWLAMGLILVGVMALSALAASERTRALAGLEPAELAEAASTALQQGGVDGLKKWAIQERDLAPGVPIYLIDEHGQDILGRVPSDRVGRRLQRWMSFRDHGGPPPGPPTDRAIRDEGSPPPDRGLRLRSDDPAAIDYYRQREQRAFPEIVGKNGEKYTLLISFTDASLVNVFGTTTVAITLFGLTMGISGLICGWLAFSFSTPIIRLQANARALAAGDLTARVGKEFAKRRDELGVLGRDFNEMADQLCAMIMSKQTLLRDMSHELRSPLARLRVALTLARRGGSNLELQLDRIERDSERLDQLIGQILQLSRLTTAEPSILHDVIDLTELITDVVEDARLEGLPQRKGVDWSPKGYVGVIGDSELIRRAVENVVRNAIRFTPPDTSLEICLSHRGGQAVLSVKDAGVGVPEEDQERIFEPFYRVTDVAKPDRSGGGLGLTITAKVMALHSGFVRARNGQPSGLVVEMGFPIAVSI